VPQISAMYGGDRARKQNLVEFGFRLPAAFDNRPLKFDEFMEMVNQVIYVSATPADFELAESDGVVVEQVIRPTGLLDPIIEVRPSENQIDDLLEEILRRSELEERTLVTTLTKRMAEELTAYLLNRGIRVNYIHSDVATLDRVKIMNDLRAGIYDVLVGVNLLREGLDLPEVSLVAILDADKEGFLRSHRSLTQTAGRAARNINGKVIMYADNITESMRKTIDETARRRQIQLKYNSDHGIIPQQIKKDIKLSLPSSDNKVEPQAKTSQAPKAYKFYDEQDVVAFAADPVVKKMSKKQLEKCIANTTQQMQQAAKELDFLQAAQYRDEIVRLQKMLESAS
jgi:excinuclease ABC subunit B